MARVRQTAPRNRRSVAATPRTTRIACAVRTLEDLLHESASTVLAELHKQISHIEQADGIEKALQSVQQLSERAYQFLEATVFEEASFTKEYKQREGRANPAAPPRENQKVQILRWFGSSQRALSKTTWPLSPVLGYGVFGEAFVSLAFLRALKKYAVVASDFSHAFTFLNHVRATEQAAQEQDVVLSWTPALVRRAIDTLPPSPPSPPSTPPPELSPIPSPARLFRARRSDSHFNSEQLVATPDVPEPNSPEHDNPAYLADTHEDPPNLANRDSGSLSADIGCGNSPATPCRRSHRPDREREQEQEQEQEQGQDQNQSPYVPEGTRDIERSVEKGRRAPTALPEYSPSRLSFSSPSHSSHSSDRDTSEVEIHWPDFPASTLPLPAPILPSSPPLFREPPLGIGGSIMAVPPLPVPGAVSAVQRRLSKRTLVNRATSEPPSKRPAVRAEVTLEDPHSLLEPAGSCQKALKLNIDAAIEIVTAGCPEVWCMPPETTNDAPRGNKERAGPISGVHEKAVTRVSLLPNDTHWTVAIVRIAARTIEVFDSQHEPSRLAAAFDRAVIKAEGLIGRGPWRRQDHVAPDGFKLPTSSSAGIVALEYLVHRLYDIAVPEIPNESFWSSAATAMFSDLSGLSPPPDIYKVQLATKHAQSATVLDTMMSMIEVQLLRRRHQEQLLVLLQKILAPQLTQDLPLAYVESTAAQLAVIEREVVAFEQARSVAAAHTLRQAMNQAARFNNLVKGYITKLERDAERLRRAQAQAEEEEEARRQNADAARRIQQELDKINEEEQQEEQQRRQREEQKQAKLLELQRLQGA